MNETLQKDPLRSCEHAAFEPVRGEVPGNLPGLSFPMELVAGMLVTLGVVALVATLWQALMET